MCKIALGCFEKLASTLFMLTCCMLGLTDAQYSTGGFTQKPDAVDCTIGLPYSVLLVSADQPQYM